MGAHPRAKRRSGAAAVELAFVLPVFCLLIFSLIEVSRLGMVSQLLAGAAREGCRVAVLPGSTQSDVQARVNSFLSGSGVSVTPTVTPSNWTTASSGAPVTVTVSVPFRQVSWLGGMQATWLGIGIFNSATLTASATFSSENP